MLWLDAPRLRLLWTAGLAAVAGAIIVTNGHWVADVIRGGFLGAWVGWLAARARTG